MLFVMPPCPMKYEPCNAIRLLYMHVTTCGLVGNMHIWSKLQISTPSLEKLSALAADYLIWTIFVTHAPIYFLKKKIPYGLAFYRTNYSMMGCLLFINIYGHACHVLNHAFSTVNHA
jgi:hypothetical protein